MNPRGARLLLIEDNPGDARLVREMLRGASDITLDGVDRLATAEAQIASGEVDVVLLDLGLPDSQGLETLARVRACSPAGCIHRARRRGGRTRGRDRRARLLVKGR
jgi:DNA-binding response OmpR family regulator